MRLYGCGYNGEAEKPGVWLFDLEEGLVGECGGAVNPSYSSMCVRADGTRLLYASCELEDAAELALFELAEAGIPIHKDTCRIEGAAGTCFVLLNPEAHCIYGADYNSGSICSSKLLPDGTFGEVWPLVQDEGLGAVRVPADPNFDRQLTAHVHTLSFVPGTSLVAAVDLGMDQIDIYEPQTDGRIDASNRVSTISIPSGCGPRIVAYHPTLPLAAVVCELACEVMLFAISEGGLRWDLVARYGLINGHAADWKAPDAKQGIPEAEYPPLAAHAEFSQDGKFLYVSTRGTNTIAIFDIDKTGKATEVSTVSCGGHSPRHFALSPDQTKLAVANQVSNAITVFDRNVETGELQETLRFSCTQPSCVVWEDEIPR